MRSRSVFSSCFEFFASLRETFFYFTQSRKERKVTLTSEIATTLVLLLGCSIVASAQSSDQNFPTHVTTNEIKGVIKPRNMGDARLTTYFYLFEGSQGDIFINVATTNFTGDIDVYSADSMKPLTKMVMYADAGQSETGRLIYLRQPARLLLRIEGRTPSDDAATYRIKFAGSFVALAPDTYEPPPTVAKREAIKPGKSTESAKSEKSEETAGGNASVNERASPEELKREDPQPKTENPSSAKVTVKPAAKATTTRRTTSAARTAKPKAAAQKPRTEDPKPPPEPDPLANVKLVVVFKDGAIIERPMTEISRFGYDNGRLTIVEKNGTITRYQMATIVKVTIQ